MKLEFLLSEDFFIHKIIYWGTRNPKMDKLSKLAEGIDETLIEILWGRQVPGNYKKAVSHLPVLFDTIKEQKEYKELLAEAEDYRHKCELEWNMNLATTLPIVEELTGLEFKEDFKVYTTHRDLPGGGYHGKFVIDWGGKWDWPNYTTIYMWHEILHHYLGSDEVTIQLITDNELRSRMNGDYYPPVIGHDRTIPLMTEALPFWRDYLESPNKDIKAFQQLLKSKNLLEERYINSF